LRALASKPAVQMPKQASGAPSTPANVHRTSTVVYPLKKFPYTWTEVQNGSFSPTPVKWKRSEQNPLLKEGMNARVVWWDQNTLRVFYGVRGPGKGIFYFDVDPENPHTMKTKPVGPIIATGPVGSYDEEWLIAPEPVRLSATVVRIYYSGKRATQEFFKQAWSLAYAQSEDNGLTWKKSAANPILTTGDETWESGAVGFCSIENSPAGWKMWYLGTDEAAIKQVGYATSSDGITWQRHRQNPIIAVTPGNPWEAKAIAVPRVIRDGKLYKVWYCSYGAGNLGGKTKQGPYAIGYAESTDGIQWYKNPDNPVLKGSGGGAWDGQMAAYPTVIRYKNRYYMWYSGSGYNGIGFAEAAVPRGSLMFRTGKTDRPDPTWSEWRVVSGDEPARVGYIQFATDESLSR
jgi:hypothetical protein